MFTSPPHACATLENACPLGRVCWHQHHSHLQCYVFRVARGHQRSRATAASSAPPAPGRERQAVGASAVVSAHGRTERGSSGSRKNALPGSGPEKPGDAQHRKQAAEGIPPGCAVKKAERGSLVIPRNNSALVRPELTAQATQTGKISLHGF